MYRKLAELFLVAFDTLESRTVYQYFHHLQKTQWLKKKKLKALQLKKLRALLTHAYNNVKHNHESFKKAGFHPRDLGSLNDLIKIPILHKTIVRNDCDSMLARNVSRGDIIRRSTSGTTSSPMPFYRDRQDVSWGIGAELLGYSWAGYQVGDKTGLIWYLTPRLKSSLKFKIENLLRRHKVYDINEMSEESMKAYAEQLMRFHPSYIRGQASSTSMFATYLLHNKQFTIRPKAVFTSCEALLPNYRRTIEEAFFCPVHDYYANSEVSHVAAQCGQHPGFHVFDENILLETVKDGEQVSPGEEGRILQTNLNSYGQPFIRYDVGDLGTILDDDCQCGRDLSLLKVVGRTTETFICSDGSFALFKDFKRFFADLPVRDFQVVQEDLDNIIITIVPDTEYSEEHSRFILEHIKFFGKVKIRIELAGAIVPEKSGKVRHMVSRVKTRYT